MTIKMAVRKMRFAHRVDELVEVVETRAGITVNVVPPVADKVLLVEHGAVGAQEGVSSPVSLADPEDLIT